MKGRFDKRKIETVKASNDDKAILAAIEKGGKIEVCAGEYWLNTVEGGAFRISKKAFNKINCKQEDGK